MKQSKVFHKGIRRVWSRLSAGSGTSRPDRRSWFNKYDTKTLSTVIIYFIESLHSDDLHLSVQPYTINIKKIHIKSCSVMFWQDI